MILTKDQIQKRVDELQPWHYCLRFPYNIVTGTSEPDYYEKLNILLTNGAFSRSIYRNVLDLGANAGIVSMWFVDHKDSKVLAIEGGDIFYEQLKFAVEIKQYPDITPIKADITNLTNIPSNIPSNFDCVLLLGVLHHIPIQFRQQIVNLCYNSVNHLGEVYIQTRQDINAVDMMQQAGFTTINFICEWAGQNRAAWLCKKDPMKCISKY